MLLEGKEERQTEERKEREAVWNTVWCRYKLQNNSLENVTKFHFVLKVNYQGFPREVWVFLDERMLLNYLSLIVTLLVFP